MRTVENRKLLIVEDNRRLLTETAAHFSRRNRVLTADRLENAAGLIRENFFDAVILDVILPDGSGLDLIPLLPPDTPVIILSSLGAENHLLDGFEAGAADYVVKPCSLRLLETRVALRILPPKEAQICLHGLSLNTRLRTVTYCGKPVSLTASEFNILLFLMQNAGEFFSAAEIYERVWQAPSMQTTTIKYHLHNVRKKLSDISHSEAQLIVTAFGKGYAFIGEA